MTKRRKFSLLRVLGKPAKTKSREFRIALGVYDYLSRLQLVSGALNDPLERKPIDEQYGNTFFGLAGVMLYRLTGREEYFKKAEKAFRHYSGLEPEQKTPSSEFNNFAVLLSYMLMKKVKGRGLFLELLKHEIENMVFSTTPETTEGNNQLALRAVNQFMRSLATGSDGDKHEALDIMNNYVLNWQLRDGIFFDYPRMRGNSGDAKFVAPLTYHAKICLATLLAGMLSSDKKFLDAALRGLDSMGKLIARDGEAFYFGRSNNTIYSYATAILAYRLASKVSRERAKDYMAYKNALMKFIEKQQRKDGHFLLVPNELEGKKCGYDGYMFLSVYNAYATVALLLTSMLGAGPKPADRRLMLDFNYLDDSGFFNATVRSLSTCLNLKGNFYTEHFPRTGPRYAPLTPLYLKYRGLDLLPSPPTILPDFKSKNYDCINPRWSGFTPYGPAGDWEYTYGGADKVELLKGDSNLTLLAKGKILKVKTSKPSIAVRGAKFALRKALKPREYKPIAHEWHHGLIRETGLGFYRMLLINPKFLHVTDVLQSRSKSVIEMSPITLRSYSHWKGVQDRERFTLASGKEGLCLILPHGIRMRMTKTICSSKGMMSFWESNTWNISFKHRLSREIPHTIIPLDNAKRFGKDAYLKIAEKVNDTSSEFLPFFRDWINKVST